MLVDTDILIWVSRKNVSASQFIRGIDPRKFSVVSYMELLQGAFDRQEVRTIKSFLADFRFEMLPLTESIGQRAVVYMEDYGLSHGMEMPDAFIAATAVEHDLPLATGNRKHFVMVPDLRLHVFRP